MFGLGEVHMTLHVLEELLRGDITKLPESSNYYMKIKSVCCIFSTNGTRPTCLYLATVEVCKTKEVFKPIKFGHAAASDIPTLFKDAVIVRIELVNPDHLIHV